MISPTARLRDALDAALATGLVVLGQVELALMPGTSGWSPFAIALLATAPLAVRRRRPVLVLAAVVLALTLLTVQRDDTFSVAQLLGMMLATYTVGSLTTTRIAVGGLAAVLAAAFVNSAVTETPEPGDYVFAAILLGVPWAAGLAMRRWRARAEELAELAARLAASREEHAALVVAAERGRIARDLHDTLAQTLNAVVVHAEAAEAALVGDEALARHSLTRIREVARDSLADTRAMLGALRGSGDAGARGLADLDRLVDDGRADGLDVAVRMSGDPGRLGAAVSTAAYRIVQESLTNVGRHASGSDVRVIVDVGEVLELEIRSSGRRGAANGAALDHVGYGLIGMNERASLLGGELTAGPEGDGFVVKARLPVGGRP